MWEIYDTETGEIMPGYPTREEAQGVCDDMCEMPWVVRKSTPNEGGTMPDTQEERAETLYATADLAMAAGNRIEKMLAAGRSWDGDVENTTAGKVFTALNDLDAALAKVLEGIADESLKTGPTHGPYFRRKLAAEMKAGKYDQPQ